MLNCTIIYGALPFCYEIHENWRFHPVPSILNDPKTPSERLFFTVSVSLGQDDQDFSLGPENLTQLAAKMLNDKANWLPESFLPRLENFQTIWNSYEEDEEKMTRKFILTFFRLHSLFSSFDEFTLSHSELHGDLSFKTLSHL